MQKNEQLLHRDISAFMAKKAIGNPTYRAKIEELRDLYCGELSKEQNRFINDLGKVKTSIHNFQHELSIPRPDIVDHIKASMKFIESQLDSIKTYQKSIYDGYIVTENALSTELSTFDSTLHKYEVSLHSKVQKFSRPVSAHSKIHLTDKHNLHPAVVEFDKFASAYGPSNRWGEFEHQVFLKLFDSKHTDEDLKSKMGQALTFKSEQQIAEQLSWYRKYISLEAAKKKALKEWRTGKNKQHRTISSNPQLCENAKQLADKKRELVEKERQEKLGRLNAYKVQKELERVQAEEDALKAQIMEAEREAKRQGYVNKQRDKVAAFKEQKRVQQEMDKVAEAESRHRHSVERSISQTDLLRMHEKNMKIVEKKQNKMQEKIIAEFEQQQKLEKLKNQVNVRRDPTRLFQKTQGQINREKDRSSSVNPVVGSRNMPHRAMPSWRKGL